MADKTNKKIERKDPYGKKLHVGEYYNKGKQSYELKYVDSDGKRKSKTAKTLIQLRRMERDIANGGYNKLTMISKNTRVNQLIEIYLDTKNNIDEVTLSNYRYLYKQYIHSTTFGRMKIIDVYRINILDFYNNYLSGKRELRKTTIHAIHHILNPSFQLALDCRAIPINPCTRCMTEVQEGKAKEHIILTAKEQFLFLDFTRKYFARYYPIIKTQFELAVRISELLGLTESDVFLEKNMVKVEHQMRYRKIAEQPMEFRIRKTKTLSGIRDIGFDEDLKQCLLEQFDYAHFIYRTVELFEVDGYSHFIFVSKTGKPMTQNSYNRLIIRIIDSYNKMEVIQAEKEAREVYLLPHFSSHTLRRSGLTRMAESGVLPKTLQMIAGHKNIETTYKYYVGCDQEFMLKDMEKYYKYKELVEKKSKLHQKV